MNKLNEPASKNGANRGESIARTLCDRASVQSWAEGTEHTPWQCSGYMLFSSFFFFLLAQFARYFATATVVEVLCVFEASQGVFFSEETQRHPILLLKLRKSFRMVCYLASASCCWGKSVKWLQKLMKYSSHLSCPTPPPTPQHTN